MLGMSLWTRVLRMRLHVQNVQWIHEYIITEMPITQLYIHSFQESFIPPNTSVPESQRTLWVMIPSILHRHVPPPSVIIPTNMNRNQVHSVLCIVAHTIATCIIIIHTDGHTKQMHLSICFRSKILQSLAKVSHSYRFLSSSIRKGGGGFHLAMIQPINQYFLASQLVLDPAQRGVTWNRHWTSWSKRNTGPAITTTCLCRKCQLLKKQVQDHSHPKECQLLKKWVQLMRPQSPRNHNEVVLQMLV